MILKGMIILSNNYTGESIQILEGLEAVRKRPGMYIGSTDSRGLHHLVWEILDNAIDEALNGYGNTIDIILETDGSITIKDEGRGMPIDQHVSGKSALEVIFTILHAGGKFSEASGYKSAAGLHGVGASVVNALSKWVKVQVVRDGNLYEMIFSNNGEEVSELKNLGKTREKGSKVTFLPDNKIFSTTRFSYTTIIERCRERAFLLAGLKINIKDLRKQKQESFCFEEGLPAFIEYLNEGKEIYHPVVFFSGDVNTIKIECAFQYSDTYNEHLFSFANLVRTSMGGSHETGLKTAFTKAFNDYARKYGFLKDKDKNFEGIDVREGATIIVSVGINESILQYESQTKEKLGTPEAKSAVENFVYEKLSFYLEENKELATLLIRKIQKSVLAKEAARKARDDARKGKSKGKEKVISGKLAAAGSKDPRKKELYIVEGDSAGGSAKSGRDSKYQAILPLRGKVLNSEKSNLDAINKNEELNTLIYAIGAGITNNCNAEESNYHKIIIMTDADTDGAHIQVLLLTFFYRYMRDLIEKGMIYIALPPLYKIYNKTQSVYCFSDEELEIQRKKFKTAYSLQRYKGLGEMNADQLWDTTMNPETRTLIQVRVEDFLESDNRVSVLMGDKADKRREWIEENVSFTLEDQFEKE